MGEIAQSNQHQLPDPTEDGYRLSGVAIVTGAASGIGRETALTFARAGVRALTLADLNFEAASKVAEESKAVARNPQFEAFPFSVNVSDAKGMEEMVSKTVEKYGRIDYGVNSAGIAYKARAPVTDFNEEELDLLYNVHVKGTMNFLKYVVRAMEKQEFVKTASRGLNGTRFVGRGSIVNLSSMAGVLGLPNVAQYSTAKAAVRWATKVAAREVGNKGIRINCVAPAGVDTPMTTGISKNVQGWKEGVERITPLGRVGEAEEIADAIVFLCSPLSSYLQGITLNIDGGMSIGID